MGTPYGNVRVNRAVKRRGPLASLPTAPFVFGSPGRTRTCDQPVNSRLLYQLSYRGTRRCQINLRILAKLG